MGIKTIYGPKLCDASKVTIIPQEYGAGDLTLMEKAQVLISYLYFPKEKVTKKLKCGGVDYP